MFFYSEVQSLLVSFHILATVSNWHLSNFVSSWSLVIFWINFITQSELPSSASFMEGTGNQFNLNFNLLLSVNWSKH